MIYMSLAENIVNNPATILSTALSRAAKSLKISKADIGKVIGKDRTSLNRGLDPNSKSGELALMFIRCYRGLFVLVGGENADMQHWMHTENKHLSGIPAEQIKTIGGLNKVLEYIDAMRGKV
jgi:hypothetical protein